MEGVVVLAAYCRHMHVDDTGKQILEAAAQD
jgi:hypothetical protein